MARIKIVHSADMVAHLWAHQAQQEARTQTDNFSFDGPALHSYHTTIGWHFGDMVLLSRRNMTMTTSKQLNAAWSASGHLRVVYSGLFVMGRRRYSAPSAAEIIEEQHSHLEVMMKELTRKRSDATKAAQAATIHRVVDTINYLNRYFKTRRKTLELPVNVAELVESSKERVAKLEKARADRAAKAQKEEMKRFAAELESWLNGDSYYLPSVFRYITHEGIRSYRITIYNGEVVTSGGAEAPIPHVRKALDFYYKKQWPWKKNGHKVPLGVFEIDWISADGVVKAGCHTFHPAEIDRFVKAWRHTLYPEEVQQAA